MSSLPRSPGSSGEEKQELLHSLELPQGLPGGSARLLQAFWRFCEFTRVPKQRRASSRLMLPQLAGGALAASTSKWRDKPLLIARRHDKYKRCKALLVFRVDAEWLCDPLAPC